LALEGFFEVAEVLVSPDLPEAFLGECEAAADPELGLVGLLSPTADASDVATQVLDGIILPSQPNR